METASKTLPESVETLKMLLLSERELSAQKNAELKTNDAEMIQLKQQYQPRLEQFRLSQQKQFGKSSETSTDQLPLFNEAEQIVDEEEAASESSAEEDAPIPARQNPKRKPLPKDLPRETVLHDLAEEDKVCDCCGGQLHQMGCDTREQLEFIPATIKVIEHVRPKYSCRSCEKQGTQVGIKMAPVAASPIPKSMATASLLS
jgi:transposase